MNCYFCRDIPERGESVALDTRESAHAAGPRRQRAGDQVVLIDGKGLRARGTISTVLRSRVEVVIASREECPGPLPVIVVGCALPKGERQKVMLDMLSQLGVREFVPLSCERSVVRATASSVEKWTRVAVEACKQSQNPYLPKFCPPQSPLEFVKERAVSGIPVYIADPEGERVEALDTAAVVALCVGPEGGFSEQEKAQIVGQGAVPLNLAQNILRIETAAVSMVSVLRNVSRI